MYRKAKPVAHLIVGTCEIFFEYLRMGFSRVESTNRRYYRGADLERDSCGSLMMEIEKALMRGGSGRAAL